MFPKLVMAKTKKAICAYQFVPNVSMANALHRKFVDAIQDLGDPRAISVSYIRKFIENRFVLLTLPISFRLSNGFLGP